MDSAFLIERHLKGLVRFVGFWVLIFGMLPVQLVAHAIKRHNVYVWESFIYRMVVRILGFKVRVFGEVEPGPSVLFAANHASYLDVPVLGAIVPALFVAKADVAHWPLFGFLTRMYGTLYVERRAVRAASQTNILRQKLEEGWRLIFFPEGTSTDGMEVLPFKSSLFAIAEGTLPDGGCARVQPVSVVFSNVSGLPAGRTLRPYYAWIGDMTLMRHLWAVFCLGHFAVDVIFHPALQIKEGYDRKALAQDCHRAVSFGVGAALAGRPEVCTQAALDQVA